MKLVFDVHGGPDETYFDACARIRNISCGRLAGRLLQRICEDQLVLAILDDESKVAERLIAGEDSRSRYHHLHTRRPK